MKRWTGSAVMVLAMLVALLPVSLQAQEGAMGETIAEGLNGPMGILLDEDGTIWAIDSGLGGDEGIPWITPEGEEVTGQVGQTARIVRIDPADGSMEDVVMLPSVAAGMDIIGGARLALLDGTLYATVGQGIGDPSQELPELMASVIRVEDGEATEVADLWDFERTENPDPAIYDSHPYGLTAGPDGNLYVADAAGNDLLRVDPETGEIELVAVFEPIEGVFPRPDRGGELLTDPVPTAVIFDESGNAYVSYLSGAPFVPGSARVMMLSSDGEITEYATGLTMLTDLRWGPDGEMYAVQFGQFTEEGPVPNSGALVRVHAGDASEVVVEGLPFPTSVDFSADGSAYVTINGVGAPGSGAVVKFEGIAAADEMSDEEMADEDIASDEMSDEEMAEDEMTDDEMAGEEMGEEPELLPVTGASSAEPVQSVASVWLVGALALFLIGLAFVAVRRRSA